MKSITDLNLNTGEKVFVRADLDVPYENGLIMETARLDESLPTLKYIVDKGGIPVIAGHMGRPKGPEDKELSTTRLIPYFNEKIGEGKYELLENLRFDKGEEENSEDFALEISKKAEYYVNECFSTCHRKHASIVGVPKHLPSYAGQRLNMEIQNLSRVLENPQRPLTFIVGGAKIDDKKPAIDKFLEIADAILVGGKIGMNWQGDKPEKVRLPIDYGEDSKDIGLKTIEEFKEVINNSRTIVWAGPMGMYEDERFCLGTKEIADLIGSRSQSGLLYSVIGGGDTVAAVKKVSDVNKISFSSTGGGAMLEFLAKGTLPGIEALQ